MGYRFHLGETFLLLNWKNAFPSKECIVLSFVSVVYCVWKTGRKQTCKWLVILFIPADKRCFFSWMLQTIYGLRYFLFAEIMDREMFPKIATLVGKSSFSFLTPPFAASNWKGTFSVTFGLESKISVSLD